MVHRRLNAYKDIVIVRQFKNIYKLQASNLFVKVPESASIKVLIYILIAISPAFVKVSFYLIQNRL